ncbi:MAG: TRAP transporter small permease [Pigmentiphaga sp.]
MSIKTDGGAADTLRAKLLRTIEYAAAILLAGIMLLTVTDVVARYLFHSPIPASFELTEMAMQIMIYLCIAVAVATNDHIKVTLIDPLFARLPRLERGIDRLSGVLIAVAFAFLGYTMMELARGKESDITAVLGWPVAPVAWVIGGAMYLSAILAAWSVIRPIAAALPADEDPHA